MEPTGITKYHLESVCIRRILEIGDKDMIENMIHRLNGVINFIMIKYDDRFKITTINYIEEQVEQYIKYLKIYKPFIPQELLLLIYFNRYNDIYNYILSKNLHIPK